MLPRTRAVVSGFVHQIGCSTLRMFSVLTWDNAKVRSGAA